MNCFQVYMQIYAYVQIVASNGCVMLQSISGAKGISEKPGNYMEWYLVTHLKQTSHVDSTHEHVYHMRYSVDKGLKWKERIGVHASYVSSCLIAYIWSISISAVSWCLTNLSHHNFRALWTLDKCCQDWVLESWINCFFKQQMIDPYW